MKVGSKSDGGRVGRELTQAFPEEKTLGLSCWIPETNLPALKFYLCCFYSGILEKVS